MVTEAVETWLADKHCGLWAQFSVNDPDGRRRAAEWFVKEVNEFGDWVRRQGVVDL